MGKDKRMRQNELNTWEPPQWSFLPLAYEVQGILSLPFSFNQSIFFITWTNEGWRELMILQSWLPSISWANETWKESILWILFLLIIIGWKHSHPMKVQSPLSSIFWFFWTLQTWLLSLPSMVWSSNIFFILMHPR